MTLPVCPTGADPAAIALWMQNAALGLDAQLKIQADAFTGFLRRPTGIWSNPGSIAISGASEYDMTSAVGAGNLFWNATNPKFTGTAGSATTPYRLLAPGALPGIYLFGGNVNFSAAAPAAGTTYEVNFRPRFLGIDLTIPGVGAVGLAASDNTEESNTGGGGEYLCSAKSLTTQFVYLGVTHDVYVEQGTAVGFELGLDVGVSGTVPAGGCTFWVTYVGPFDQVVD